jgi:hypothetical protein
MPGEEQAGDAASAAYAELVEDTVQMGPDGRDFDFKPTRNLLVAEIVSDHAPDLELAYREFQDRRLTYMTDSQPS